MRKLIFSLLMAASTSSFAVSVPPTSYLVTVLPLLSTNQMCDNMLPLRETQILQVVMTASRVNPLMVGFEADDDTLLATLRTPTPQWLAFARQEAIAATRATGIPMSRLQYEGAGKVCTQEFASTAINYAHRLVEAGIFANAQRMVNIMKQNRCIALQMCGMPSKRPN
jgi:hypothetical protein